MTPKEVKIETLNDEIEERKMKALWWMASAISGECKNRDISHGIDGPQFTDDEKVKDAMETAARHIDLMKEIMKTKKGLLFDSLEKNEVFKKGGGSGGCNQWDK